MTSTRRTRVVLVCEATGGGVGKHVLDVAERLPARGFDTMLVHGTRRAEHEFTERVSRHREFGYQVALVDVERAPGPRDLIGVVQVRRAVRDFGGADVLHGHSAKGGALARLSRWGCAGRVFYTPHAFYAQAPTLSATARRLYGLAENALALATDQVIATSGDEREMARSLGIPARKITVVENGIPLRDEHDLAAARASARGALGIEPHACVVAFVGRLVPQKAPLLAVETFRRILARHPAVRFVLVGEGPDAPAVERGIADAGLGNRVHWVRRGTGHALLPAADILLVTSQYEGFPYVMLEALDAGCAIVTTVVGGAKDCVIPGKNGAVVSSTSAASLADAVAPFIESPDRLAHARRASRERARAFEVDRMVDRLVALYRGAANDAT